MGTWLSKSKETEDKENHEKKTRNKNAQKFDGFENDRSGNAKASGARKGKKSRSKRYSSSSEDSSTDSDADQRKPKVSSSKTTKRGRDGSITVVNTKTIVGGDQITIGQGAKNVVVNLGDRRSKRSDNRKNEPRSPEQSLSKPDFSKLKPRREDENFHIPACFLQLTDRSKDIASTEVLVQAAKSVGKIHASDGFCATGFRVGPNYLMTCKHVKDGILKKERNHIAEFARGEGCSNHLLEKSSVYVDFNFVNPPSDQSNNTDVGNNKFYFKPSVKFENEDLDVAVLELKEREGVPFPDALINFSQVSPNKMFTFIGHPAGGTKKQNEVDGPVYLDTETYRKAVNWSMRVQGSDGFVGVNIPERLLFHCSFQQGGSGSPGIAVEGGKKAVVVTMLLRGYPEWYYDPACNTQLREQVARDSCIEQGVDMVALYQKMHSENPDLCYSIFGQNA